MATDDIDASWSDYLARFHEERGGITEALLRRARADGEDPYAWCAAAIGPTAQGPVIDLACGSGPLADHLPGWVGLDRADGELDVARQAGRGPLVRASADHAAFPDGSAGAVACSMGLQIIQPLEAVVAELARLLPEGGRAVLLLPASGPLRPVSAVTYLWLQVVLRQRIGYPNDAALRPAPLRALLGRHRLLVDADERRRFRVPVDGAEVVALFVRSLYLPGGGPDRQRRARRALSWRIGRHLDIPLRRVVLRRLPGAEPCAGQAT